MEPRVVITREAEGGAIGAGLAVVAGTDDDVQAKLPAAAGAFALGISGNKDANAAGKIFPVIAGGFAKAIAGGAIAVGNPVQVGGVNGRLTAAAPAAGVNALIIGWAYSAAAADGDEFDVLVEHGRIQG